MASIHETAYLRIKSTPSTEDLIEVYTPSSEERQWAKKHTRQYFSNFVYSKIFIFTTKSLFFPFLFTITMLSSEKIQCFQSFKVRLFRIRHHLTLANRFLATTELIFFGQQKIHCISLIRRWNVDKETEH